MVLVMESDGTLTPSVPQERFSRTYYDGIGQGSARDPIRIFGEEAGPEEPKGRSGVGSGTPAVRAPSPALLAAIDDTALRYAAHPGLRAADITVTDWLTLYRANIEVESAYNPAARSRVGAVGLGQLMPETAEELGVDPHDVGQNLDGSARYLAMMLAEFGDPRLALAAYNAGPDAVREHSGIPPYRETQTHVRRVLAVAGRLQGETP